MPAAGKVKGRRPGRPPGAKNKPKVPQLTLPTPVMRSNGTRKRASTPSFLQVSPKHAKLIQKWSNDTKIGMQQVLEDFLNAGAVAAPKIYKGLINSRKAIEDLFDAETNTEGLADKTARDSERVNGLPDTGSSRPASRPRIDEEQLSLAPLGPGHLEETGTNIEDSFGLADAAPIETPVPDAPPTAPPEEEEPEPPEETGEPPY